MTLFPVKKCILVDTLSQNVFQRGWSHLRLSSSQTCCSIRWIISGLEGTCARCTTRFGCPFEKEGKLTIKLKLMKRAEESLRLASLYLSQIGQLSYYFVSCMYYVVYPFRNPAGHVGVDLLPSFPAKTWHNIFVVLRYMFFFQFKHIFRRTILHQVSVWNREKRAS